MAGRDPAAGCRPEPEGERHAAWAYLDGELCFFEHHVRPVPEDGRHLAEKLAVKAHRQGLWSECTRKEMHLHACKRSRGEDGFRVASPQLVG